MTGNVKKSRRLRLVAENGQPCLRKLESWYEGKGFMVKASSQRICAASRLFPLLECPFRTADVGSCYSLC
jgi:hypothetical protein